MASEEKRAEWAAYRREWYQRNKEHRQKVNRAYQHKHKYRLAKLAKANRIKIKIQVITHYGNGKISCTKCPEVRLAALTIDHINGGGGIHRKELKRIRGENWYKWLIKNGFPDGYQTLCMNCQFVKREQNKEWRKSVRQ